MSQPICEERIPEAACDALGVKDTMPTKAISRILRLIAHFLFSLVPSSRYFCSKNGHY